MACGETLHVAYQCAGDGIGYVRSTDGGRSWGQRLVLSDTANTFDTWHPHIMRFNGDLLAVWRAYFTQGVYRNDIAYCFSHNGGVSWTAPQYILDPNLPTAFYITASASDSIVNIMISMYDYAVDSVRFIGVRSTDFGASWSWPRTLFRAQGGGVMDQASFDNFVHMAWSGRFDITQRYEIYYLRSTDGGISWSPNLPLSTPDQYASQLPAIAADDTNRVFLTWMDFKYTTQQFTGDIFIRQSRDSGGTWAAEEQITFDHFASRSVIVPCGDTLHVVWEDESQGISHRAIRYTRSTDGGANWGEPLWIDGTDDDSHSPALAASNVQIYAIWYDEREAPDSAGLYFAYWPAEPDGIDGGDAVTLPNAINLTAYPNPFNAATTITVQGMDQAEIAIYDITGRRVIMLRTAEGRAVWEAKGLSSGVYFARAGSDEGASNSLKLILMK
jgi:hypothetical protein